MAENTGMSQTLNLMLCSNAAYYPSSREAGGGDGFRLEASVVYIMHFRPM